MIYTLRYHGTYFGTYSGRNAHSVVFGFPFKADAEVVRTMLRSRGVAVNIDHTAPCKFEMRYGAEHLKKPVDGRRLCVRFTEEEDSILASGVDVFYVCDVLRERENGLVLDGFFAEGSVDISDYAAVLEDCL